MPAQQDIRAIRSYLSPSSSMHRLEWVHGKRSYLIAESKTKTGLISARLGPDVCRRLFSYPNAGVAPLPGLNSTSSRQSCLPLRDLNLLGLFFHGREDKKEMKDAWKPLHRKSHAVGLTSIVRSGLTMFEYLFTSQLAVSIQPCPRAQTLLQTIPIEISKALQCIQVIRLGERKKKLGFPSEHWTPMSDWGSRIWVSLPIPSLHHSSPPREISTGIWKALKNLTP